MNTYKFPVQAYLIQTARLQGAEDLTYRRLLDVYYMTEMPLTLDVDLLAGKVGMDLDVVEMVLAEFFTKEDDGYHHADCDKQVAGYKHRVNINRAAAPLGGLVRSGKAPLKAKSVDKPVDKNPCERFQDFWDAWPPNDRKVARKQCEDKWRAHNLDLEGTKIVNHVIQMKSSEDWVRGFIPAPLVYLNQKRWEAAVVIGAKRRIL